MNVGKYESVEQSFSMNVCALVAFSQQAGGSVTSLTDWWYSVEGWTLMMNTELCWLKSHSLSVSTNYLDWHATKASLWAERSGHSRCPLSSLVMHIGSALIFTMQPNSEHEDYIHAVCKTDNRPVMVACTRPFQKQCSSQYLSFL